MDYDFKADSYFEASANVAKPNANSDSVKQEAYEAMKTLEGWCSEKKASILIDIILAFKPKNVVEIGVFGGKSLIPMAMALRANGRGTIFGVDPWTAEAALQGMDETNKVWWESLDYTNIFKYFVAKIDEFQLRKQIILLKTTSKDAPIVYDIDVLHIDGNHSAETSYIDVTKWVPLVKKGGVIILSDVFWLDTSKWEFTQAESIKWLDAHCRRQAIVQDNSDWAIWIKE